MFDLGSLNPEQRQAVVTHRGPVLILAGAGTGKTRTLTCRVAQMVRQGIAPDSILAVTFTNKAAREMQERVRQMLPGENRKRSRDRSEEKKLDRPTVCTFHSLCVRILRQHIEKLGWKKNFVIYDTADQLGAVKKILSGISARGEKTDPSAVLALLSKFKNSGPDAKIFGDENIRALAEHVKSRYDTALHAANAVDFDDLILLTMRLFREHPGALALCRERWRFVMVDEYQDTNSSQFAVVHALTQESRNLCVVGDDDQSIYGWRGAEIANILDLEKHFPEVQIVRLEQNYRSTNTILKAANGVIQNNTRRRGKTLWSAKGDGERIMLHTFSSDEEEARTVVENIEYDRNVHRVGWAAQAVLFRTNLQARPLETELRKARVRYRLIGGQSFFDRREIRDFLAYLKTFVNPHDDIALLRIANTPARGLSDVTLERLLAFSSERNASVFTVMRHTDVLDNFRSNTREAITAFVRFIEEVRAPLELPTAISLVDWADEWLKRIGYLDELRRTEKDPEVAENRVRNLCELLGTLDGDPIQRKPATPPNSTVRNPTLPNAAVPMLPGVPRPVAYEGSPMERMNEFLEDLTLDQEREEEKENEGELVTLITMHAAKGLEFPRVHIVGVEDGLLPHSRSKLEGTVDEERRLFYVAITRAQETLRISHCESRRKYGQLMPCHPSAFLKELPTDCVQHANAADAIPVEVKRGPDFFALMRAATE